MSNDRISIKCQKCNDTGLVPSTALGVFSGKPIPGCLTYCSCHEDEPEHYRRPTPEDFDFPMSDTFRGASFEYCGLPDPGYYPVSEATEQPSAPQEVIHRHSDMSKKEYAQLQQDVGW